MTPEEFDALMAAGGAAPEAVPPAVQPSGEPTAAFVPPAEVQPSQSTVGAIASDIGTGLLEVPRAVASGVRNAVSETAGALVDAGNFVGSGIDKVAGLVGGAQGKDVKAPELPAIDAPKSVTGGLVSSVSQFVTGMIGLGKITGPIKVAGRGAKVATEVAKAATVGAVAFDPHGARLSDLVESIPGASNAVTQFLKADPTDSRALGRVKNALESIGMDAALVGGIAVSARLYRAVRSGDQAEIAAATKDAGKLRLGEEPKLGQDPVVINTESTSPGAASALTPGPVAPAPSALNDIGTPASDVVSAELVPNQTAAAKADGQPAQAPTVKLLEMEDDQFGSLVKGIQKDVEALSASGGSWDSAVAAGHVFGKAGRVPWQKLADYNVTTGDIDNQPILALIGRTAEALETPINKGRGGSPETGVRSDAVSNRMLSARAALFNEDPAALFGVLEQAGAAARTMQANMEAGFLITQRAMQDSFAMASRIRAGALDEWGGDKEAALASLKQLVEIGATAYGHSASMMTNAGRTVRRMRSDFAFTPEQIANIKSLDGEALAAALERTGGDPLKIKQVMNPSMLSKTMDAAQWLLVNNLLWGLRTHFVNFATNAYMVGVRPAERMIGSFGVKGPEGSRIFEEGWRQYTYLGGSLVDGWRSAVDAWKSGDSVLAPHNLEANTTSGSVGTQVAQMQFKPWDSITNVLHNALLVPAVKVIGTPTRALGTVDELVKQGVYRSKVQAQAHVEALRSGLEDPKAINAFVEAKLSGAFDDAGRATDLSALQEAKIATFQQDLLPGTMSKGVQNFASEWPGLRLVIPFVKTPANVLRMGWKLTPGLNMAQTEYRQMIQGAMGPELQAQAVGQMAMGSLFLGTAGFLAASGRMTGGGPSDQKLLAELKATGWQPYSFVSSGADGSLTYTPYGRYDPIAMPFGIVADLVEGMSLALKQGDEVPEAIQEGSVAVLLGLVKQFANKTYLQSLNQTMEAVMDPDNKAERVAGQMVSNFIPAASGLRFINPDPLLRDARSVVDNIKKTIPGLSETVPPKRDMWGDPIVVHKGLWVDAKTGIVDAEMRRMITEAEMAASKPSANLEAGVDLRDLSLVDGRNAYDVYQELARQPAPDAKPLKDEVATIMATEAYKKAPDGGHDLKGTKLFMVYKVIDKYRDAAGDQIRGDENVREALAERQGKIAAAYSAAGSPKTAGQKMQDQLGAIGKAFGVNLGP